MLRLAVAEKARPGYPQLATGDLQLGPAAFQSITRIIRKNNSWIERYVEPHVEKA